MPPPAPTSPIPIADQVRLDPAGPDRFRSRHVQPNVYHSLFGGQIIAQALAAADATVEPGRDAHSLHAYFLRPGRGDHAVDFEVERLRDGRRFATRRVLAVQGGVTLAAVSASYHVPLAGFTHARRTDLPAHPDLSAGAAAEAADPTLGRHLDNLRRHYSIDICLPGATGFTQPDTAARRHYWLRARGGTVEESPARQRQILAYLSDFMFVGVALSPHTVALPGPHIFVASLDHAVWFHRPVRCDQWLLFETESPYAGGAINLARGFVHDADGNLVATLAQEALQLPTENGARA